MNTTLKRILSLMLALIMIAGMFPTSVFASDYDLEEDYEEEVEEFDV